MGWGTQPLRIQWCFFNRCNFQVEWVKVIVIQTKYATIPFNPANLLILSTCRPSGALGYLVHAACYKHIAPLGLNTSTAPKSGALLSS